MKITAKSIVDWLLSCPTKSLASGPRLSANVHFALTTINRQLYILGAIPARIMNSPDCGDETCLVFSDVDENQGPTRVWIRCPKTKTWIQVNDVDEIEQYLRNKDCQYPNWRKAWTDAESIKLPVE